MSVSTLPSKEPPGQALSPSPAPRGRGRPRKTQDQLDEGNRRQQLIGAAARLFRRQGFDGTSTRDIALASGMQSGSPFYHFENKQALLFAVMQEGLVRAIDTQAQTLQALRHSRLEAGLPPPDAKAQFSCLLQRHFEVLLGEGSDFIPVMLYEFRSISDAQRQVINELQRQYESAWLPILQALHEQGAIKAPIKLARLLIFGALNWSVKWYQAEGGATQDQLCEAALQLFLHEPPS